MAICRGNAPAFWQRIDTRRVTPFPVRRLRAFLFGWAVLIGLVACAAETWHDTGFVGRLDWPAKAQDLGGLSGLELAEDGSAFLAISDRGQIVSGRLNREGGLLVGVDPDVPYPLHGTDGMPLADGWTDAEGLALGPDGQVFISFEGYHRVWRYPEPGRAEALPQPEAFLKQPGNAGFEALAIDTGGRLYTLPERSGRLTRPFPVWRFDGNRWEQPFSIPRRGGFLPVGADFGPDGRFYLLEREFTGLAFRSRVRRFELGETRLLSEEMLFESPPHRHGNLEGLAAWRDRSGAIRLTMISDDNLNSFQRSEIVEYRVAE